ncbi:hypothetical protein [Nocardia sp. NPDC051832]|uniref:DUF6907 domain-containing protein n=1 Tax=Nocardia sp. NPDC051832 TaxID=3155673 RepID=UPI00344A8C43
MSDARTEERPKCPSWCAEHYEELETVIPGDEYRQHIGLKSTRTLSIYGLQQLTVQLSRSDTPDGEVESYAIELRVPNDTTDDDNIWIQLTPADAEHLARHLDALNAEVRRVPAGKQEGTSGP